MIFISHNHNDKNFIGPMAEALKDKYGQDNVFFDTWSIRPGENIVERMDTGIENCKVFFFFITENSLSSKMVSSEWTSALMQKAKNPDLKFIPIRAENINIPTIISSLSYLDLVNNGLDVTLTQMIEIIDEEYPNTIFPIFENIKAFVILKENLINYYIYADKFFEPSSSFVITTTTDSKNIEIKLPNQAMFEKGNLQNGVFIDGINHNAVMIKTEGGIKKGFIIEVEIEIKDENIWKSQKIEIGLYHQKYSDKFEYIPYKEIEGTHQIII